MKKIWLCIITLLVTINSATEATLIKSTSSLVEDKSIQYADFTLAYKQVREEEGYYSNHPNDLGKETYAGITKRYNPDWYGWNYVDKYNLKQNQYVPKQDSLMTEFYVLDFYLTIWVKEGFDQLTNQTIANYLFDMRVNLSRRQTIKLLQQISTLPIVNTEKWVLSSMDSLDITLLKKARTAYYLNRIKKNPSQLVWRKGWLRRATK